jgi:hypothetical protein
MFALLARFLGNSLSCAARRTIPRRTVAEQNRPEFISGNRALYRNDALFAPFGAVRFGAVRRVFYVKTCRIGAVLRGSARSGAERCGATYAVSPKHLRVPTLRRTAPRVVYRAEQRRNTPNQLEATVARLRHESSDRSRCADGFPNSPDQEKLRRPLPHVFVGYGTFLRYL